VLVRFAYLLPALGWQQARPFLRLVGLIIASHGLPRRAALVCFYDQKSLCITLPQFTWVFLGLHTIRPTLICMSTLLVQYTIGRDELLFELAGMSAGLCSNRLGLV